MATGATLHGIVDTNHLSSQNVTYWAPFGTSMADYPHTTGPQTFTTPLGSAAHAQPIAIELTGLELGTTYHFRLVARHHEEVEPEDTD